MDSFGLFSQAGSVTHSQTSTPMNSYGLLWSFLKGRFSYSLSNSDSYGKVAEQFANSDAIDGEAGLRVDSAVQASKSSTVDKTVKVPQKVETEVAEKGTENVAEKASKDIVVP